MELDERLIQLRIDIIEANLKEIRKIAKEKKLTYRDELALKHALLEAIEACTDIANHIIATKGWRRPESYRDVFKVLEENKVISRALSRRLQEMSGFRNVLVHKYASVDMRKVMKVSISDIRDIEKFVKIALKLIKKG